MAIDPKQLAAFAGRDDVSAAKPAKAAPAPAPEAPVDEAEPAAEEDAEGDLEAEFPGLFPLLEDYGEDFESVAEPMDQAVLTDESADISANEEQMGLLLSGLDGLPDDLQDAIVEEIPHIEWDKAQQIADALEAGGHISNPEVVTGLLFHIGQLFDEEAMADAAAAGEAEPMGDEMDPEDDASITA